MHENNDEKQSGVKPSDARVEPDSLLENPANPFSDLSGAILECSNQGTDESWKKLFSINRKLILDFPSALQNYIENHRGKNTSYSLLSYCNVPENISSLSQFNPFYILCKSIFTLYKNFFNNGEYQVSPHFLFLAKEFKKMGWGSELSMSSLTFEFQLGLVPEVLPWLNTMKHSAYRTDLILSQLINVIKDANNEELNQASDTIYSASKLPTDLRTIILNYANFSFFSPKREEFILIKKPEKTKKFKFCSIL